VTLRSIRWRIAVPYVALILASMLGLAFYASEQMRRARLDDLETQLLANAQLMADSIGSLPREEQDADALNALATRWAHSLEVRVTLIGTDGVVLGESHQDRFQMDNHLGRPEVQQALSTGQGSRIRFSQTVGYEMMYVALAMANPAQEQVVGVVRVALPLRQIEASVNRLRQTVLTAALLTALVAVILALYIAERTARPVRQLTRAAERLAQGDLEARLFPASRDEIGQLTHAFNRMAEQLRDEVSNLAQEQRRLAAVLENMADGALITDDSGRVRLINPAAARLLRLDAASQDQALGLSFAQVVRHHQLIELWRRCHRRGKEQVETVELDRQGLFLQAIVTPLRGEETGGYLVVLQDLTRIRRLETVRRDFISNISHELRTPLAGLKALVDTLRGGALQDPPAAQRFLNRMDAEVDVLTQMVQELLDLSRIESGKAPLRLVSTPVDEVVLPPIERLRPQAEREEVQIVGSLPPTLPLVLADAERARQVVRNLVHNAIKFTPAGGTITVAAQSVGNQVVISVKDTGVGIPAEDLARIFERFYKADRARSGGGTGLGLAIARHIVQGHGGRIWAESVEGQGSTFYFSLPALKILHGP
jgi:two-component system phosphate regulon sensor histidine kinase PhoR